MFTVIYQFQVIPNKESDFAKHWREGTKLIRAEKNSLGSRLHKASDGTYVAYAQWASREAWKNSPPSSDVLDETLKQMRSCCSNVDVIFELDVVDDLLVK